MTHTKSADFLLNYFWKGKSKEQIIHEMDLPEYEQKYLDAAMQELAPQGKFSGMDLDQYFLSKLDEEEEDVGPLHDDDIVYLKR